jgi:predicted transcriptional regulator
LRYDLGIMDTIQLPPDEPKKSNETPVRRLRMDNELWAAAERVAMDDDRSVSWVIRKALEEYIERHRAAKRAARLAESGLTERDVTIASKRSKPRLGRKPQQR